MATATSVRRVKAADPLSRWQCFSCGAWNEDGMGECKCGVPRRSGATAGPYDTFDKWKARLGELADLRGFDHEKLLECFHSDDSPGPYAAIAVLGLKAFDEIPETEEDAARKAAAAGEKVVSTKRKVAATKPKVVSAEKSSVTTVDLDPLLIEVSSHNPRQTFDDDALKQLGESLQRRQIEPIAVRPLGEYRYELLWGERRLRAALLVKLPSLRAEVHECTDEEAVFLRGEENERREALNAVEQAIWYQQLLDTGLTQQQVAAMVGCEQAKVSTAVGLLKLPAEWQQRVISREITGTHAKALLPWKDHPTVMEAVEKALASWRDWNDEEISSRKFEDLVSSAVRQASRSMTKASSHWDSHGCFFTVTKEIREQLDIRSVKSDFGDRQEQRAFNTKLWDKLNKPAKAAAKKEADPRLSTHRSGSESSAVKRGPDDWRVKRFLEPWAAQLIGERLKKADRDLTFRLFVVCSLFETSGVCLAATGGKKDFAKDTAVWQWLQSLSSKQLDDALLEIVKAQLSPDDDDFAHDLPEISILVSAATELEIDLQAAFKPTADMLADYPIEQLRKMPAGKRAKHAGDDRAALIEAMIAVWRPGEVPKEYSKLLKSKGATP